MTTHNSPKDTSITLALVVTPSIVFTRLDLTP
jgi:hypothetical protein